MEEAKDGKRISENRSGCTHTSHSQSTLACEAKKKKKKKDMENCLSTACYRWFVTAWDGTRTLRHLVLDHPVPLWPTTRHHCRRRHHHHDHVATSSTNVGSGRDCSVQDVPRSSHLACVYLITSLRKGIFHVTPVGLLFPPPLSSLLLPLSSLPHPPLPQWTGHVRDGSSA